LDVRVVVYLSPVHGVGAMAWAGGTRGEKGGHGAAVVDRRTMTRRRNAIVDPTGDCTTEKRERGREKRRISRLAYLR
jgi:hypothetical protein